MLCAPLFLRGTRIMSNSNANQTTPETVVATPASLDALFDNAPAPAVAEASRAAAPTADDAAAIVPTTEPETAAVLAEDTVPDAGAHPTIAKRIVFDGNAFDIPRGTPTVIVNDNNALRRAYATAMARPELTQAQMEEGTTVIDGHTVPMLTLRVRPQVKGASTTDALPITDLLQRIPALPMNMAQVNDRLLRRVLRGGHMTLAQAVRYNLGDRFDKAVNPHASTNHGGFSICSLLDTVPSDAAAAPADVASFDSARSPSGR